MASVPHLIYITPVLGVEHCATCSTLHAKLWQGAVEHCDQNCGNRQIVALLWNFFHWMSVHYVAISLILYSVHYGVKKRPSGARALITVPIKIIMDLLQTRKP